VADHDLVGTDQDVSHDEAQDTLAIRQRRGLGGVAKPAKEALQALGQGEIARPVEQLSIESVELRPQARLPRAQVGHPGAELLEREQILLVGGDEAAGGRADPVQLDLEAPPLRHGRVGPAECGEAALELRSDQGRSASRSVTCAQTRASSSSWRIGRALHTGPSA
jgi:hypothetical protein